MARLHGFDRISFVYDRLSRVVFGNAIVDAQKYFIEQIPTHAKVLILGGGTGWFLAEVLKSRPSCEVWYIEASAKMINMSKRRTHMHHEVHFIHGTEQDINQVNHFDLVITNFYFDLFTKEHLPQVFAKINSALRENACWIVTDFIDNGKLWQRFMLKLMYAFFRCVCGIAADKLPQWKNEFMKHRYVCIESALYYHGFIETSLYQTHVAHG